MPDQSAGAPQSVAASAQQLPPAIRELHRAVLRGFHDTGRVHRDDLHASQAALGVDLDDALHHPASADLVHTAPDGQIEIAYPFSGRPTGHTVHGTGHPPVAAMCAIDALGILLMTGTDGVIDSADPGTGTPIRIQRHGEQWTWQPATAVVIIATPTAAEPWPILCAGRSPSTPTPSTRSPTSTTIPNSKASSSARPTPSPSPTAHSGPCSPADQRTQPHPRQPMTSDRRPRGTQPQPDRQRRQHAQGEDL